MTLVHKIDMLYLCKLHHNLPFKYLHQCNTNRLIIPRLSHQIHHARCAFSYCSKLLHSICFCLFLYIFFFDLLRNFIILRINFVLVFLFLLSYILNFSKSRLMVMNMINGLFFKCMFRLYDMNIIFISISTRTLNHSFSLRKALEVKTHNLLTLSN